MNARLYGPATVLDDGRVLVAGGEDETQMIGDAELYDPVKREWTATGALQVPRDKHASILLPNGHVLITGGSDKTGGRGQMTTTELYDPASGRFSLGPSLHAARFKSQGSMTSLPSGGPDRGRRSRGRNLRSHDEPPGCLEQGFEGGEVLLVGHDPARRPRTAHRRVHQGRHRQYRKGMDLYAIAPNLNSNATIVLSPRQ
jgi:hypothetical protein